MLNALENVKIANTCFGTAVMRIGKRKEKDKESGEARVDGVTRLICLSKGHSPLKGKPDSFYCT